VPAAGSRTARAISAAPFAAAGAGAAAAATAAPPVSAMASAGTAASQERESLIEASSFPPDHPGRADPDTDVAENGHSCPSRRLVRIRTALFRQMGEQMVLS